MSELTLKLNSGHEMPIIGLGCWMGQPGSGANQECYEMCVAGLKAGYRNIDTASGYGNENAVGKAVRESGIPRNEIFVTTKLGNNDHARVQEAFEESLERLDIEYIDLYLMHWPHCTDPDTKKPIPYGSAPTFQQTWKDMSQLLKSGKVKSIGVSNFSVKTLKELLVDESVLVPAVNQIEAHIYLPQNSLTAYAKEKGITLTAYSPIGGQKQAGAEISVIGDPIVKQISDKINTTPAQVLLSWLVQRGFTVIPKSSNPERMKVNLQLVKLSQEEVAALDKRIQEVDYKPRVGVNEGMVQGWTLEQMGWEKRD